MGDLMLIGVLRAPHDPDDRLAMLQLIDRARQAADEIEWLRGDRLCRCADEVRCERKAEIERLRDQLDAHHKDYCSASGICPTCQAELEDDSGERINQLADQESGDR